MRFRPHYTKLMPLWLIPMLYTVASVAAGLILPRLEHAYRLIPLHPGTQNVVAASTSSC